MTRIQKQLMQAAKFKYGKISKCIHRWTWESCFTATDNLMIFWFNTPDSSTHIIEHDLKAGGDFFQQIWYNFLGEQYLNDRN